MLKRHAPPRTAASPSTDLISRDWSRRHWLQAALVSLAGAPLSACGGGGASSTDPSASPAASTTGRPPHPSTTPSDAATWAVAQGLVGAAVGWLDARTQAPQATLAAKGLRSLGGEAIQTSDDWYFGSNGKAMTAMVIARLVSRGVLSWDSTVAQCLPEAAATQRPAYNAITLRQWLDHLGGVVPLNGSSDDEARFMADLAADPGPLPATSHGRRVYASRWVLMQAPPQGITPGVDFSYSNAGYMIAATMAEAVTGLDFEVLLRQELTQPLGLALNGRALAERPDSAVQGHGGLPGHLERVLPEEPMVETWLACLAPAGHWAASPETYAKWLQALMQALQGQPSILPLDAVSRLRALPVGQYALGWRGVAVGGVPVLHHSGAHAGCMAEAVVDPQGRWAGFAMCNTAWIDEDHRTSWVLTTLEQALVDVGQSQDVFPTP